MKRRWFAVVAMVLVGIAGCSSSGTHTQTLSPSPSSSAPPATSSTSPSDPSTASHTTPVTKPSTITPPTVVPAAQGAVNSYIAFVNLSVAASVNPTHANLNAFSKYVTGSALTEITSGFQEMAKAGYAYKGTPPKPRLKVTVSDSSVVVLSDCGLESKSDPYVEYDVKTGKVVPQPTRTPAPPYLHVITMHSVSGGWKLASIDVNSSKTCTA